MFRVGWGQQEEEFTERTYPDPILVRPDKYWMIGGSSVARSDPLREIDPDSINLVQAIEAARVWEHLKIPIFCIICKDRKAKFPLLDRFHWKYLHCTKCFDFFVCWGCVEIPSANSILQLNSHRDHGSLVVVQTRPFSAPLYDGSDLGQLEAFKGARTADKFFLYFPWFFHCFGGMDAMRNHYREVFIQKATEEMARPGADRSTLEAIVNLYDFPVDWFLRSYGHGNWRQLHQSLRVMINERVQVARSSARFHKLLLRLQDFVKRKEQCYGTANIPPHPSVAGLQGVVDGYGDLKNFILYLVPLHVLSVQNGSIDQAKLHSILDAGSHQSLEEPDSLSGTSTTRSTLASAGNHRCFIEGSTSHLSNPAGAEILRLWPMFKLLFQDNPEFQRLVHGVPSDMTPFVQYGLPEWLPMLEKDSKIRERLWDQQYQSLPQLVAYLKSPSGLRHSTPNSLSECRRQRVLGNFEAAIKDLQIMNVEYLQRKLPNVDVCLELQLAFLEQGYFQKALACTSLLGVVLYRGERDLPTIMLVLVFLTSRYAECFVRGKWEEALSHAGTIFVAFCGLEDGEYDGDTLDHILLRVRVELMYHKIVIETYRDLRRPIPTDKAIVRLQSIRRFITEYADDPIVAEVAWETLSVELEMRKRHVRAQYLELESAFSMTKFHHTPAKVIPLLNSFKPKLQGQDPVSHTIRGRIELLQAELLREVRQSRLSGDFASRADASFRTAGCTVGCLDVQEFHSTAGVVEHSEIIPIYNQQRSRNDIARLQRLRILKVSAPTDLDSPAAEWLHRQRATLRELAAEAGDNIAFHRWNLRKYAADSLAGASLHPAEVVLTSDTIHSVVLATLASFNLSKAYTTLGNYFAASLNAMLHLSLTIIQDDAEDHQRAILNVLRVFSETVAADPARFQERLAALSQHWKGFLDDTTIHRWDNEGGRCDEIERFIEGACFLPLLSGRVEREPTNGVLDHNARLEESLAHNLDLAFDLYETIPTYNASAIVPRLSLALGASAAYIGNLELAIRCYWEGLRSCHSGDSFSIACLRLEAGKLMTVLGEQDPEHWMHVVAPGRSLLAAAANELTSMHLSGAVLKGAEANMYLLRSFVSEARARKRVLDNMLEENAESANVGESLVKVSGLFAKAQLPLRSNEAVFSQIAEFLNFDSPFELEFNLVKLAENPHFYETRQLALELGVIVSDIEVIQSLQYGTNFWNLVQGFKSTVLSYRYKRLVPGRLLESIRSSPEAWKLYMEERSLIDDGPQGMFDMRLLIHQAKMRRCPELKLLMSRREGRGVAMSDLSSLVRETMGTTQSVVMIDWIHFRNRFQLIGYNATTEKFCIFKRLDSPSVAEVEKWVSDHIRVSDSLLSDKLDSLRIFEQLHGLVEPIHRVCSPGDILIFSPSQSLNSVPLHAIPYRRPDDIEPIIQHHPIMYTPSNAILKECVQRALSLSLDSPLEARFFYCYNEGRGDSGSGPIRDLASILSGRGAVTTTTSGSAVTQTAFKEQLPDADILHFHGHVAGQALGKYLVLKPEASLKSARIADVAGAEASPDLNLSSQDRGSEEQDPIGRFTLQDVYAATLRARLVLLMGCGSGAQVVSKSDDALGLVNAFLAAGATSVVGTLWPLNNADAEEFSREFYNNAFGVGERVPDDKEGQVSGSHGTSAQLVDVSRAVQLAVNSIRMCKEPGCRTKSPEDRLQCHRVAPYHWAPFAAWGSWVCQQPSSLFHRDHDKGKEM